MRRLHSLIACFLTCSSWSCKMWIPFSPQITYGKLWAFLLHGIAEVSKFMGTQNLTGPLLERNSCRLLWNCKDSTSGLENPLLAIPWRQGESWRSFPITMPHLYAPFWASVIVPLVWQPGIRLCLTWCVTQENETMDIYSLMVIAMIKLECGTVQAVFREVWEQIRTHSQTYA